MVNFQVCTYVLKPQKLESSSDLVDQKSKYEQRAKQASFHDTIVTLSRSERSEWLFVLSSDVFFLSVLKNAKTIFIKIYVVAVKLF
jgi:hypothetical protein